MQHIFAFEDAALAGVAHSYLEQHAENWVGDEYWQMELEGDAAIEHEQRRFEAGLVYDKVLDFVGVQVYFRDDAAVAWYDYENVYGYKGA